MSEKKRILTGIRPTGPLHLGHYAGALENWVKLKHEYDCSFLIADYQVSDYADGVPRVRNAVWEMTLDWLAVGLDPESGRFVETVAKKLRRMYGGPPRGAKEPGKVEENVRVAPSRY